MGSLYVNNQVISGEYKDADMKPILLLLMGLCIVVVIVGVVFHWKLIGKKSTQNGQHNWMILSLIKNCVSYHMIHIVLELLLFDNVIDF